MRGRYWATDRSVYRISRTNHVGPPPKRGGQSASSYVPSRAHGHVSVKRPRSRRILGPGLLRRFRLRARCRLAGHRCCFEDGVDRAAAGSRFAFDLLADLRRPLKDLGVGLGLLDPDLKFETRFLRDTATVQVCQNLELGASRVAPRPRTTRRAAAPGTASLRARPATGGRGVATRLAGCARAPSRRQFCVQASRAPALATPVSEWPARGARPRR